MAMASGEGLGTGPKAQNEKAENLGQLKAEASCSYDKGHIKLLVQLTAAVVRLGYSTNYIIFYLRNLVLYMLRRTTRKQEKKSTYSYSSKYVALINILRSCGAGCRANTRVMLMKTHKLSSISRMQVI